MCGIVGALDKELSATDLHPQILHESKKVSLLDNEFMEIATRHNPKDKMRGYGKIEKWVLRKTFEDLLSHNVAWRQLEQFSDGVGHNCTDTLRQINSDKASGKQMAQTKDRFPVNSPMTKQKHYYRSIFEYHFPANLLNLNPK